MHNHVAEADQLSQKWFEEKAMNTDVKKEFGAIKNKLINPIKSKIMGIPTVDNLKLFLEKDIDVNQRAVAVELMQVAYAYSNQLQENVDEDTTGGALPATATAAAALQLPHKTLF